MIMRITKTVTSNDNNKKIKVNKSNVDESKHEEDFEKGCAKCKINQENSSFTEVMHETLVSKLKRNCSK